MNLICLSSSMRKVSLIMCLTVGFSFASIPHASAVFDVKDAESIAKLGQILNETVQTKTAIASQINAMLKDMGIIDEKTYKKITTFITKVNDFVDKTLWDVENSEYGSIIFSSDGTITIPITGINGKAGELKIPVAHSENKTGEILLSVIPLLGGETKEDGTKDVGLSAKQRAWISAIGYLMKSNRHTLNTYNKLNSYLTQYQAQLDQLLEMNGKIEHGTVEATQIGNQISYVRGRIEQIRTAMTALDSQQKIVKAHAEAQREVNENIAQEAQTKTAKKSVEEAKERIAKSDETRMSNADYKAMMKKIGW